MRRFHVHISVDDLAKSKAFYTHLFGQPDRVEADYVKWMVEDPRLNFAISKRGSDPGINHLGIQVESDDDLRALRDQLESADAGLVTEKNASCCYAKSDKYWITDPQGIAWETYRTLGTIPTFGGNTGEPIREGNQCDSNSGRGPSCAAGVNESSIATKSCCT
jgi:catechol 2,3-dioxygenase-like lactoylglutathione lyase family enzyme